MSGLNIEVPSDLALFNACVDGANQGNAGGYGLKEHGDADVCVAHVRPSQNHVHVGGARHVYAYVDDAVHHDDEDVHVAHLNAAKHQ